MSATLRKINEQVIVITGASSGIGLTTARMAAEQGAKLVLASRNADALDQLASELRRQGCQVATVAADVGNVQDVERIGQTAIERFGRIDTWINNAGVGTFGKLEEVALEDHQRLFQTNFWGVVHGSLEAVRRMKQGGGGTLINVGSEVSDAPVPLQGMYSASKHAVKAFTDSLRMELEKEDAPISVSLIKPAAIDTLFAVHAKNYMDKEAVLPPPVYAPDIVAKAILHCAQHYKREVFVGGASKLISASRARMPHLMDSIVRASMYSQQKSKFDKMPGRPDALHKPDPTHALREREGMTERTVKETSLYTNLSLNKKPLVTALLGGGALFAAWKLAGPGMARRKLGRV
jgi:short-subunit dehydrogenase